MGIDIDRFFAVRNESCLHCGFCNHEINCPQKETGICIGCGACIKGCPQEAISLMIGETSESIRCTVDGQAFTASGPVSVLNLIRALGKEGAISKNNLTERNYEALCETGGCWDCAVLINGVLTRSCVTPLQEGMDIVTDDDTIKENSEAVRIITLMRPHPHYDPSVFTHGCNYSCGICHNWDMTFASNGRAMNPREAVSKLHLDQKEDSWVGISGGEPTLNRRWLLETVHELRKTVPNIRIQLDTNASLLTTDYIDDLIESGITHISPDIKALHLKTFMELCGVKSEEKARQYLETSWEAVRYINERYKEKLFMAVSFPYFPAIHTLEELKEMALTLADISKDIPVTLVEYQPAFRLRNLPFVSSDDLEAAQKAVEAAGLRKVVVQGGPGIPLATDPLDLAIGSEDF
ncbi:MAG: radical SAM protein [Deltaproteobacteria bacterium]|nr:radical SAM protein [Deltaproteobacteria bacterium]